VHGKEPRARRRAEEPLVRGDGAGHAGAVRVRLLRRADPASLAGFSFFMLNSFYAWPDANIGSAEVSVTRSFEPSTRGGAFLCVPRTPKLNEQCGRF
jgi:hypothetical protein